MTKKVQTDEYAKKKAVKLVVLHIKKKMDEATGGEAHELDKWFEEMNELVNLPEEEFDIHKYYDMRRQLNDHIDCVYDVNLRYKLRDSWISFGKALDKKANKPR